MQDGDILICHDFNPMLDTGQAADICNITPTDNPDLLMTGGFHCLEVLGHTLAGLSIQREGMLHIVHRQAGAQGNALGGNDIAQFLALSRLTFT